MAAERAGVTAERIIEELAKIGFADIAKSWPGGPGLATQDADDEGEGSMAKCSIVPFPN